MIEEIKRLIEEDPIVAGLSECRELFWRNDRADESTHEGDRLVDTDEAEARLLRFAPYIERVWPEVEDGIIESPLREISQMQEALAMDTGGVLEPVDIAGRLFLKCDSHLPISGSIKARGGIYEVLKYAEEIGIKEGKLSYTDNYSKLADDEFRELFSNYSVAVGSTGNLGLSIGIMSAVLGFKVTVHMSADARQWKKDMLRSKGVIVKEYPDDYEAAVAQGRREANEDPTCHFVDDENSLDLFAGYSVAARRLKKQLEDMGIEIGTSDGRTRRLYVYLPCGVGGAPGGVTYGLKEIFGQDCYCFFAEPTHAPCMTLGLASGLDNGISVRDIGIDGITEADGLAVGRPSALVAKAMKSRLHGCFTVDDDRLFPLLSMLQDTEEVFIEPSACAGFAGIRYVTTGEAGVPKPDADSIHIVWATGGAMVPEEEKMEYYRKGYDLLRAGEGQKPRADEGQKLLEAHMEKTLQENNEAQKDTLNGMMASTGGGCSFEDKTLTFCFPVQNWQANRVGNLHGGMICTAFDLTIAALARFFAGENFAPTISLDVSYIRPVQMEDELIVTAKATATGRRIIQLTAEAKSRDTGKLVATASSVYLSVDTNKEVKVTPGGSIR